MKKFIIVLCSIIIIIIALPTFLAVNINYTLLRPEFYAKTLRGENAYARFLQIDPKFFGDEIKKLSGKSGTESEEGIEKIVGLLQKMPPEALQSLAEESLLSVSSSLLEGKSSVMEIGLSQIKTSLLAQGLTKDEVEFVSSLKDSYSLQMPGEGKMTSSLVSFAKSAIWPVWAFCVLLFILIWLLEPDWRGRVRVTGIVCLVFSTLAAAIPLILISIPMPQAAAEIQPLLNDIFESIGDRIGFMLFRELAIIAGAGIVLIVISFFIPKKETVAANFKPATPKEGSV